MKLKSFFGRAINRSTIFALLFSLLTLTVIQVVVAPDAEALTSCGNYTTGLDTGDLTIRPLHGKAFYLDNKNGINASYIGYAIKNDTNRAIDDLWISVTNFVTTGSTSVLSLVNSADQYQPIGTLGTTNSTDTAYIYFLVKGSGVTTDDQTHDVKIYSGYPGATVYQSNAAQCTYTFSEVDRVIAASPNKVTEITTDTDSPKLGGTVTVTVKGATGQGGSGTASPDGAIMWMSGASNANWPTRALRLESTSIAIKYKKNGNTTTFTNQLVMPNIDTGGTKFTSSTTYTATFKYRVMGKASVNPTVSPVANISSGTQIKHTGSYPSALTTINLSGINSTLTSTKQVVSSSCSGSTCTFNYKVTITDSAGNTGAKLDSITDIPDSAASIVAGQSKIIDNDRTNASGTSIADPVDVDVSSAKKYVFGGPFTVNSSGQIILTYSTTITKADGTYNNKAYGNVGGSIVGVSSTTIKSCPISVSSNTTTNGTCTNVTTVKQDQSISFTQPPDLGVGGTYTLDATASSGLDITYTSTTTSVCNVSGNVVIALTSGTCTIKASQSGDTEWNAAQDVSKSLKVKTAQEITFNPTSPMSTSGAASTQSVAATSNSNLTVTLTVVTTDVCSVTGSSSPYTINAIAVGTCVIIASQAGNDTYGPALDVERTIYIGTTQGIYWPSRPADQTATSGTFNLIAYSRTPNADSATNTNLPILFVSKSPSVCTTGETSYDATTGLVNNASYTGGSVAVLTLAGAGVCELVASQDGLNGVGGSTVYAPATEVTHTFMVGNKTPDITISGSLSVNSGTTNSYTVTVTAPIDYPTSGTLPLAGTVTLYAKGWILASSQVQSSSVSSSLAKSGTTTATFNVTAIDLAQGSANDQFVLTASFSSSNSNFTNSATEAGTTVAVVAPGVVLPEGVTNDVSTYDTTTATLPGAFNAKDSSSATAKFYISTTEAGLAEDTSLIPSGNYVDNSSSGDTNKNFSATAIGLNPATVYFYQTKATRGSYTGSGEVKKFLTKPAAPTNVTITTESSAGTGSVSFTGVNSGSSVSISYTVTCTATGASTLTGTGSNSPISISGLVSGTTYSCTVKANASSSGVTGGGDGNPSSTVSMLRKKTRTLEIYKNGDATKSNSVQIIYGESLTASVDVTTANGGTNPADISAAESEGQKSLTVVSGGCSVANLVITKSNVGTCVLRGNQSAGDNYDSALTQTNLTIEWIKATVAVSPNIPVVTYGDSLATINPSYNASHWKNGDNQGTAAGLIAPTCSASGYTNTTAAGTAINVTCTGGSATNYDFTYSGGTFTVARKSRTISLTTPSADTSYTDWSILGPTLVGTASAGDTDGTKRYTTSSASTICTVNETTGKVTFVGPGDCVVNTSIDEGTNHSSAISGTTKKLTIGQKTQVLSLSDQNLNLSSGTSLSLSATTNADINTTGLGDMTYELDTGSSSTSGCAVVGSTLTFTQAGTCYVKVTKSGNTHWTNGIKVATFVISAKKNRTISVKQSTTLNTSISVTYGDTVTAMVEVDSADDEDASTNNDKADAEVDGTKSIDVTEGSCTVSGFVISISSVGTCKIRGRMTEGSKYAAKDSSGTLDITFNKATIDTTPSTISVTYGDSLPTITPNYNAGHFKKSETKDSSAFTTDLTPPTCGVAAGYSYNETTTAGSVINIVCSGGSATNYQFTHSPGSFTVAKKNHVITFNSLSDVTVGNADQILPEATDQNQAITYVVNDSNVCEIVTSGGRQYVKAKAAGNCQVTASSPASTNYNAATSSNYTRGFVISAAAKLNRTIEINNADFNSGIWAITDWNVSAKRLTSAASHDDSDNKTYSTSSSASICTIDSATGDVTFKGAGDCNVSVTIATGNNYNSASSTTTKILRIGKRNQTISLTQPSAMTVGDSDQSITTSTDATGLSPTATVDASSSGICEIVGGKIRAIAAGTCKINSSHPGNDNWNPGAQVQKSFVISARATTPAPTPTPDPEPVNQPSNNNNGNGNNNTTPTTPPTPTTPVEPTNPGNGNNNGNNGNGNGNNNTTPTTPVTPVEKPKLIEPPVAPKNEPPVVVTPPVIAPPATPVVAPTAPVFQPVAAPTRTAPTVTAAPAEVITVKQITVPVPSNNGNANAPVAQGVQISGNDWSIAITSTKTVQQGQVNEAAANIQIEVGNTVTTFGTGFKPKSQVDVYVFSTPTWLGSVMTDENGNYTVTLPMPASLPVGDHVFQAQGITFDNIERTANVPITLIPAAAKPTGKRSFEVFYAMDSFALDAKGLATIKAAYNAVKAKLTSKSVVTVEVVGWVQPTKNSPNVNLLSQGRAKAVVKALKKLGLKANYVIKAPGHDKRNIPQSRRASTVITWTNSK